MYRDDYSSSDASTKDAVAQTTAQLSTTVSTRRFLSRLDKLARLAYPLAYFIFVAAYFLRL